MLTKRRKRGFRATALLERAAPSAMHRCAQYALAHLLCIKQVIFHSRNSTQLNLCFEPQPLRVVLLWTLAKVRLLLLHTCHWISTLTLHKCMHFPLHCDQSPNAVFLPFSSFLSPSCLPYLNKTFA